MPVLQTATVLHGVHQNGAALPHRRSKSIADFDTHELYGKPQIQRSGSLLSPLFRLLRSPGEVFGNAVDRFREAVNEREGVSEYENRKTILHARLTSVRLHPPQIQPYSIRLISS